MGCAPALMLLYGGGYVHRRMPDFVWCTDVEGGSKIAYPETAHFWFGIQFFRIVVYRYLSRNFDHRFEWPRGEG